MNALRISILLALSVLLAACAATQSFTSENAPEYVIVRQYSPFYRLGPMQTSPPDASLIAGARVKLLRQEMGYSLVQLEDNRTGYVANENMAPAPPRPPAPPSVDEGSSPTPGKKRRGGSSPRYTGDQFNDIPLPEPNVPPPDLNVAPEELPAATPTPAPAPEKPQFRY